MAITMATLEDLRRKLDELPPQDTLKREISKQEAVAMLTAQVGALQKRGYTVSEIADILTSNGLQITVATLKSYLTRAKSTSRKGNRKERQIDGRTNASPREDEAGSTSKNTKQAGPRATSATPPRTPLTQPVGSGSFKPRDDSIEI